MHSSLKSKFSECLHRDLIIFSKLAGSSKDNFSKNASTEDLHIAPTILFQNWQNHQQTIFPRIHSSLKFDFSGCLHLDPSILFQNWQDHRKDNFAACASDFELPAQLIHATSPIFPRASIDQKNGRNGSDTSWPPKLRQRQH